MIGYEICPFFIITSSLFSNDLMALLSLLCVCVFPNPTLCWIHPWSVGSCCSCSLGSCGGVAGGWRWRTSMSWEEVEVLGGGKYLRRGWRWAGGAHRKQPRAHTQLARGLCWRKPPAQTVLRWPNARGPFESLWLPLSSPGWCPASTVSDQRLSSPAPGCLGSLLLFCSLNLFIASCNQSLSR